MKLVLTLLICLSANCFAACTSPAGPEVDWSGCDKTDGMQLAEIRFGRAQFIGTSLRFANLSKAYLVDAKLKQANLIGANLRGADLTGVDLTDVKLYAADLSGARLNGATLTRANMAEAKIAGTDFSGAKWIDGKKMCAPGSIGACR